MLLVLKYIFVWSSISNCNYTDALYRAPYTQHIPMCITKGKLMLYVYCETCEELKGRIDNVGIAGWHAAAARSSMRSAVVSLPYLATRTHRQRMYCELARDESSNTGATARL